MPPPPASLGTALASTPPAAALSRPSYRRRLRCRSPDSTTTTAAEQSLGGLRDLDLAPTPDNNNPASKSTPCDASGGAVASFPAFTEDADEDAGGEEEEETLDPASQSFSLALRECQNQRTNRDHLIWEKFRSEPRNQLDMMQVLKRELASSLNPEVPEALSPPGTKPSLRRPASLDGVDAAAAHSHSHSHSPRLVMRCAQRSSATSSSRSRSGVFPSPGTPGYRNAGGAMAYQKGWSSERVPLPVNSCRRYVGGSALLPFNNGRTVPSKWEDAEKWICSPVFGDGVGRPSVPLPHHPLPKSKSGPLGPPRGKINGPYSAASPLMPCFDSGRVRSFAAESPFMAGVLVPDRGCYGGYSSVGSGGGGSLGADGSRRSCSANAEPYIGRSASVHGWSDLIESSSSLPSSQDTIQDDKIDSCREAARISPVVLRKDVATQMSPEGSTHSSSKESPFSPSPSARPIEELKSHFSKTEVRDVQVDDQVTVTGLSKKHLVRGSEKRSSINILESKKKTMEDNASAWGVTETTTSISMSKREEAKITAWENLQKAKAEAAVRKLEMKLEKKRSSSMDKILNKLRSAQRRAEEMRSSVSSSQASTPSAGEAHVVARMTKRLSYFRRTGQSNSIIGCFTCPAF